MLAGVRLGEACGVLGVVVDDVILHFVRVPEPEFAVRALVGVELIGHDPISPLPEAQVPEPLVLGSRRDARA